MKLEYVKPELEELELILEGSFLDSNSIGIDKGDEDIDGDDWD